jgi:hypothetical protein
LLHHRHEAEHRFALQPVDVLENARHADASLYRIEQRQAAQYLHVQFAFPVAQLHPGHFVVGERDFLVRPELHNILIPERDRIIVVRTVPVHGFKRAHPCLPPAYKLNPWRKRPLHAIRDQLDLDLLARVAHLKLTF